MQNICGVYSTLVCSGSKDAVCIGIGLCPILSETLLIMAALRSRCGHYIFALWFLLLFFFPRLISAVADWMSTILPHMVWPECEFRMQV